MSETLDDPVSLAERARAAIAAVRDPEIGVSLGRLGMVRGVEVDGATVKARIALTIAGCPLKERIAADVAAALRGLPEIDGVQVEFDVMSDEQRGSLVSQLRGERGEERFFSDGRTSVIAVSSGKGGVGKSTIAVNLACTLAATGRRVGLLDADVWGFSVPRMLGITAPPVGLDGLLLPAEAHGVKVMSVGLFAEPSSPVVWRGPLLHKTIRQFLADVHWGELDVLLLDLPPGTGDVPISLAAMVPDASFVVVTTPQDAARTVAERAGRLAQRGALRITGVIENMSAFVCPCCGKETEIFGAGGGDALARSLSAPLLARIPAAASLRAACDLGVPLVVCDPDAPAAARLREAAESLLERARPRAQLAIAHVAGATAGLEPEGSIKR